MNRKVSLQLHHLSCQGFRPRKSRSCSNTTTHKLSPSSLQQPTQFIRMLSTINPKKRRHSSRPHISGLGLIIDQHLPFTFEKRQSEISLEATEEKDSLEVVGSCTPVLHTIDEGGLSPKSNPQTLAQTTGTWNGEIFGYSKTSQAYAIPSFPTYNPSPSELRTSWLFGQDERCSELIMSKRSSLGEDQNYHPTTFQTLSTLCHDHSTIRCFGSSESDSERGSLATSDSAVILSSCNKASWKKQQESHVAVDGRFVALSRSKLYPLSRKRYKWLRVVIPWVLSLWVITCLARSLNFGIRTSSNRAQLRSTDTQAC